MWSQCLFEDFPLISCLPSAAPVKKTSSTWRILRRIWVELGYRGLFAGESSGCCLWGVRGAGGGLVLTLSVWMLLFRSLAPGAQGGPLLRRHHRHLWVWKGLLPEDQHGVTVSVGWWAGLTLRTGHVPTGLCGWTWIGSTPTRGPPLKAQISPLLFRVSSLSLSLSYSSSL